MTKRKEQFETLFELLRSKAGTKQLTYRNVCQAFEQLKIESKVIVKELNKRITPLDKSIVIEFKEINEFEFHLKFSGDLLVFMMQSNIITFDPQHELMKNEYVKEKENRKYFGHIMLYNFLADSYKFNRLDDPGYLIARLLINCDNHFFVEGVKPLNFLFPDIGANLLAGPMINLFIEKAMIASLENDLVAPPYPKIKNVKLVQMINQNIELGRGHKIGFHMSYQS